MTITDQYNGWEIFSEIPDGWKIDKTVGSPLTHHVFITNGKSILNGGKRALLFVRPVKAGAALFEKGSLLPDLEDWRYRNCIDFAPPADSKFLFADMPYAVDRLWCEEYRQGLNKIGLHE